MPPAKISQTANDTRLIERWLPIDALGEESVRERRSMTALPPTYYLHIWWARRPLVASRAAILASILPEDADRNHFLHALGIHGDPVSVRAQLDRAKKTGENLGLNPYGYRRAFQHAPNRSDKNFIEEAIGRNISEDIVVLDPTAGGGSIPFESARLGFKTLSNDLNPVASLIQKATLEYPMKYGSSLLPAFETIAADFLRRINQKFEGIFPSEPSDTQVLGYLWARTVRCPYCEGVVPLSPNWKLAPNNTGVRLKPFLGTGPGDVERHCDFVIVKSAAERSVGTVADGDGTCPFPDCGRVIDGDEIKRQAQAGLMGERLFAVALRRKAPAAGGAGKKGRQKWERAYRAPNPRDRNDDEILARLSRKKDDWDALNYIPNEKIGDPSNYDRGHRLYGMYSWSDMFSPRQLLTHGLGVETFNEMLNEAQMQGALSEIDKAAFVYLSFSIDKFINFNCRSTRWGDNLERIVAKFDQHNYSFKWSYAEMAAAKVGSGYEWVVEQTASCIQELVQLARPDSSDDLKLIRSIEKIEPPQIAITCKSGDDLDHLDEASVDVIVIDPPYYDNVMYSELSDFFYVWLKRTAGQVIPELFTRSLTDKENEAVANTAKFADQKGSKSLAGRDYQQRMARIFEECRRVLKPNGIMTLMFTHKATGAWDALTKGLMEASFIITASWPINTEAEGSLHIKDKSAANSTIFLVCRPRLAALPDAESEYWEDVEPLVAAAVRRRVEEFQKAGIGGVDLYLACFGPALEEFSRHWPLKRGTPRPTPEAKRRQRQTALFEEEWDPYAVTPEDALDAARREVKRWRLEALGQKQGRAELDPLTSFFVLAWDSFRAPVFPYDEALRLARAVGVDLDSQVVGVLAEKKGSDLLLWDSGKRAAKASLGAPDGSRAMIDALHHAAHSARTKTLAAAKDALEKRGLLGEASFRLALQLVLEVLPVSRAFSGVTLDGDVGAASNDFEALENLRRLALADDVPAPEQLKLWTEMA